MIRVVFADDAKPMRDKMYAELRLYPGGCQIVAQCEDGQEAIEETLKHNPDITLLDVIMSPMGGLDAAKILRQQGHKILLITSSGQGGIVGDLPHLIKPYTPQLLYYKIAQVLSKK